MLGHCFAPGGIPWFLPFATAEKFNTPWSWVHLENDLIMMWPRFLDDLFTISFEFFILRLFQAFFFCLGAFGATLILHDFFNDFVGSDSGFSSRFRVP